MSALMRRAAQGVLLSMAGLFTLTAAAVPVSYELDVVGFYPYGATGCLGSTQPDCAGGTAFQDAILILTMESDTSTVLPFTIQGANGPVNGYINLIGNATFTLLDPNNNFSTIGGGSFLSGAGIFVSVDNTNNGIGFGSFGVPPGSVGFPGQATYPSGMLVYPVVGTNISTYDLRSAASFSGFAITCVNFPATPCGAGIALPTTVGALTLNQEAIVQAQFSATIQSVIPFASLSASAETEGRGIEVEGSLALAANSNGINPLSEAVTVQVNSYAVTIPPGSFKRSRHGGYEFKGRIADVTLEMSFKAQSPANYTFDFAAGGSGLPALASPLTLQLTIGDDSGTASVTAEGN
jgi:hypothetical protein